MARLKVEVIRAERGSQSIVELELEEGATALDAIRASKLAGPRPEQASVGIFGNRVAPGTRLKPGDRVEIYRALRVDPKEARRAKVSAQRRTRR